MRSFALVLICILASISIAASQTVGLVLSGGAAKGIAHVGVIKVLEENNIPIDYVAGTSMGAVVGGFYAAGYSSDQMKKIALSEDFQQWVNGKINLSSNYYFVQPEPDPSWLNLDIRIDSGLSPALISNLGNDLSLNFALASHLAQASQCAQNDFDSLFVPFRATASEVFTQERVNLKSGRLNDAVRASMTVPLFYRPIKVDNRYLFDGGIYNNLPIDIMQEDFAPDIIIAVNVSDKNFQTYPYDNDETLIHQVLGYSLLGKSDTTQGPNVIYIQPDMTNHSSFDFSHIQAIHDSGIVAANQKIEEIKSIVSRRVSKEELTNKRQAFLADTLPYQFQQVSLEGFKPNQEKFVRQFFGGTKAKLTLKDIESRYYRLTSEEYFNRIFPNIDYDTAQQTYAFHIQAKPQKRVRIEPGGLIATRDIGYLYLGVKYTHLGRFLNTFHAQIHNGKFYRAFRFSIKSFISGNRNAFIQPYIKLDGRNFLESEDILEVQETPTILTQSDKIVGVNVGASTGNRSRVVGHLALFQTNDQYSNTTDLKAEDILDKHQFLGLRTGISWEFNTLNRIQFASKGAFHRFSINYFDGEEKYNSGTTSMIADRDYGHIWVRGKIISEEYFPMGKFTLGYKVEGVISNQKQFANYRGTILNAPAANPLPDSRTFFLEDFRAFSYGMAGTRVIYHLGKNLELRAEGHGFVPFWKINEDVSQLPTFDTNEFSLSLATSGGIMYHSPIGPIGARVNYLTDEEQPFSFMVHIGYFLYHERAND